MRADVYVLLYLEGNKEGNIIKEGLHGGCLWHGTYTLTRVTRVCCLHEERRGHFVCIETCARQYQYISSFKFAEGHGSQPLRL